MRTARVAVVGAGPSGLYAADALVRASEVDVEVDIFDRLPTPYGLVRYGVAPDHPRIKGVIGSLRKVLEHDRVRLFGDVELGDAVTAADLGSIFDAVVYATGAAVDRRLDIPGEDLPGSCSATEFVSWYSGHPDSAPSFVLDARAVAVVGAGNVALDVARLLTKSHAELAGTDMPVGVLEAFEASRVRDVYLVCRRGPERTRFTAKELRELGELGDCDVVVDGSDLPLAEATFPAPVASNLRILRELSDRPASGARRRVHLCFRSRPVAITGTTAVEGLAVEATEITGDGVVRGSGDLRTLPVDMVVRAVGYRSPALPGLPHDVDRGLIPSSDGRVVDGRSGVVQGQYVTGWAKRGPSGVVGTNRACAVATVNSVLADLAHQRTAIKHTAAEVDALLAQRGVRPVAYGGWLAIDSGEIALGASTGRERAKIVDWSTLRRLGAPA
ncbi:MAG: hypothetical protein ABS81_01195 [Pseudonocardia sp. SCN 72-86]|nr:MAG: hypothetical protein ABS81_01195 [Pseudonocardia sp. SCN 72-86]